jgi:hypothetical protein
LGDQRRTLGERAAAQPIQAGLVGLNLDDDQAMLSGAVRIERTR